MTDTFEVNLDGLVGPTHNYAGLACGNVASMQHGSSVSNPRDAFLQGLDKMRLMHGLGLKQMILPPHERPHLDGLRRLGFTGSDEHIIEKAAKEDKRLLAACYSASAMWAANAATVSPSPDTADGNVHFTPANLVSQFHRSLETDFTGLMLRTLFPDNSLFRHHKPLPGSLQLSDEGAANHARLCASHGAPGIELFVYGRSVLNRSDELPSSFPARHTREASEAVARLHVLDPARTVFARQNPHAIDQGVFHNDVICVGNENVLFFHEEAFAHGELVIRELSKKLQQHTGTDPILLQVPSEQVSVTEAVQSYLFNSQLVTLPEGGMALIAPAECRENTGIRDYIETMIGSDNPIRQVIYTDVRQSMMNGGGPACLRLRVVLTKAGVLASHQGTFFSADLFDKLSCWGTKHYRDRLSPDDLRDPKLIAEIREGLEDLTEILDLGSIYPFQRDTGMNRQI